MKQKHKSSGIVIETSVLFYEEIQKYNPGVVFINPEGMKTNRIATDPTMYRSENEAEEASLQIGKMILSNYLSGKEALFFDQN